MSMDDVTVEDLADPEKAKSFWAAKEKQEDKMGIRSRHLTLKPLGHPRGGRAGLEAQKFLLPEGTLIRIVGREELDDGATMRILVATEEQWRRKRGRVEGWVTARKEGAGYLEEAPSGYLTPPPSPRPDEKKAASKDGSKADAPGTSSPEAAPRQKRRLTQMTLKRCSRRPLLGAEKEAKSQFDPTKPMGKAEYAQLVHLSTKCALGEVARQDSARYNKEAKDHKAIYAQHGRLLKEELHSARSSRPNTARGGACATPRERADLIGSSTRSQVEALRLKRSAFDAEYAEHGRKLIAEGNSLSARKRLDGSESLSARVKECAALRQQLKAAKEATQKEINDSKKREHDKVRESETAGVDKGSKEFAIIKNFDRAKATRQEIKVWKAERERRTREFLDSTTAIKAHANERHNELRTQQKAAKEAEAKEVRRKEALMREEVKKIREEVLQQNKATCDGVKKEKVREPTVEGDKTGLAASVLALASELFWSHRKRGADAKTNGKMRPRQEGGVVHV